MMQEHRIVAQVQRAQKDVRAADALMEQYLPFIRSQTASFLHAYPDESRDELSVAMLAFYESIVAYQPEKGAFLTLASAAIRNRLIDYVRIESRHSGMLSLDMPSADEDSRTVGEQLADERDTLADLQDQMAAEQEITEFSQKLSEFGITLAEVAEYCPKQERTMSVCMQALDYARAAPELLRRMEKTGKLPLKALAAGAGVSYKTLERHRKYLAAILLAYTNGYEIIRGHLSRIKRKEGDV